MREEPWLQAHKPDVYMPMIDTAEIVAKRYGISREQQDIYGAASQQRHARRAPARPSTTRSCHHPGDAPRREGRYAARGNRHPVSRRRRPRRHYVDTLSALKP